MARAVTAVLALGLFASAQAWSDYDASRCIAWGSDCPDYLAKSAEHWCEARKYSTHQHNCCKYWACDWCESHPHADHCKYQHLLNVCQPNNWRQMYNPNNMCSSHSGGSSKQGGSPQSSAPSSPSRRYDQSYKATTSDGSCAWRGEGGKIAITTGYSAWGNWQGMNGGVEYKPYGHGTDTKIPPNDVLTFKFTVDEPGTYYLTLFTNSAGHTEHNDVFVELSAGLQAKKQGHQFSPGSWAKAYQNVAGYSKYVYTKDHDPHHFETGWLEANKIHTVKLGGRSTKFRVDKIVMVKCQNGCWNDKEGYITDVLNNPPGTSCN